MHYRYGIVLLVLAFLSTELLADSVVVFNEVHYNPQGMGNDLEWVELYNQNAIDVDLSEWRLTGGIDYTFPAGTVIPGLGYLVIAKNPGALETATGYTDAWGPFEGNLANDGETLRLMNNSDRVMNEVAYNDDSILWPGGPDGTGFTLAKLALDTGAHDPRNWSVSEQVDGTPGAENFPAVAMMQPVETTLISANSTWRYDDTGVAPDASWKDAGFNDTAWLEGGTGFYSNASALPDEIIPIPRLFGTKLDSSGVKLSNGELDQDYINAGTDQPLVAMLPNPAWLGEDANSGWVGLSADGLDRPSVGDYEFQTTFDLTGTDHTTAEIDLRIVVDNQITAVLLNGVNQGIVTSGHTSFSNLFSITNDFQSGQNLLQFMVTNTTNGPMGLRVEMNGTVEQNVGVTAITSGHTAYYFRKDFDYNFDPFDDIELELSHNVNDGAVFYLNGVEIYRANMPTGTVVHNTSAVIDITTPSFSSPVAVPSSALISGTNVLAVELHDSNPSSDDMFFDAELRATRTPGEFSVPMIVINEVQSAVTAPFFIELFNPDSNDVDLTNYIIQRIGDTTEEYLLTSMTLSAGGFGSFDATTLGFGAEDEDLIVLYTPGKSRVLDARRVKNTGRGLYPDGTGEYLRLTPPTPGSANQVMLRDEIVINEIMYHNRDSSGSDWIEFYNRSGVTVELTGWRLDGGIQYDFPENTSMAAGEYLVLAGNLAAMKASYPTLDILGEFDGNLSDGGEEIVLLDETGNPADRVAYYDDGRWPNAPDGGGSSLELRDPDADNASAESWAASDEADKSAWNTYSYTMTAANYPGVDHPDNWNEFVLGLLDAGEVLLDDISVIEDPNGTPRQFIQNIDFEADAAGTQPNKWRLLGTHGSHGLSEVIEDPDDPTNKVMRLVATGQTEHMHNHAETTLHDGSGFVSVTNGREYQISYRAKWISGSNQINTRLYFSRCQKTLLIDVPALNGTPGAQNSRYVANAGPTFADLSHGPVLPSSGEDITVAVKAFDPDGIGGVTLRWSVDEGVFQSAAMTDEGNGLYRGVIPGEGLDSVIQFYVEATDGLGASEMFPARGPGSRAIIKVAHPLLNPSSPNTMRVFMLPDDVDFMYESTNVQSNDKIGCTIIYNGNEVFYDAGIRLRRSLGARASLPTGGFVIKFSDPEHLFRGVHESIKIDRNVKGLGNDGSSFGQVELLNWHILNRAGGIPSMHNDLIYFGTPYPQYSSSAMLNMAGYRSTYQDEQFSAAGKLFKFEYIYFMTQTTDGNVESLKKASPRDTSQGTSISDHGFDKEAYRWNFLVENQEDADDYRRIIELCQTFSKSGADFFNSIEEIIDIDAWMRTFAGMTLINPTDNYTISRNHNMKILVRPGDERVLWLPWDFDFLSRGATTPIVANDDIEKMVEKPAYKRLLYSHLLDVIERSVDDAYLDPWAQHYQSLVTGNQDFQALADYAEDRANFIRSQIQGEVPSVSFEITTNGGEDFAVVTPEVSLDGKGWLDIRTIRISGSEHPLDVEWNSMDAWSLVVPLQPGMNEVVLEAYDFDENVLSTDSITITTSYAGDIFRENLRVTELMYNPIGGGDYEYLELFNAGVEPLDLTQLIVGGAFTDFVFTNSPSTSLGAGEYILLVSNLTAFESRYGTGLNVAGQYIGNLSNGGETITITKTNGVPVLEFEYGDGRGWWLEADGPGHSLVPVEFENQHLGSLSYGRNWRPSSIFNGSPGAADSAPPPTLRINEVSPHTDTGMPAPADSNDWFELVNLTDGAIGLNDWYVSDDKDILTKYKLSEGYGNIGANGRIVFYENPHFNNPAGSGFGLNKVGEDLFLSYLPADPGLWRVVDVTRFNGVENEEEPSLTSWGRIDNGEWWGLTVPTAGLVNGLLKNAVVINEFMYQSLNNDSGLEYIELINPTDDTIELFHPAAGTWRIAGGVDFTFPPGVSLGAGENLLIVNFAPEDAMASAHFQSVFGTIHAPVYGPFDADNLSNLGERIALERPQPENDPGEGISWVIVDEVIYFSLTPWTSAAAGTGESLHRIEYDRSGNDWGNWVASPPTPGAGVNDTLSVNLSSAVVTHNSITAVSPHPMIATFSDPVKGFTFDDIVVSNGSVLEASFAGSDGDDTFGFSVQPAGDGVVSIYIPGSSAMRVGDNVQNTISNTFSFQFIAPSSRADHWYLY